MKTSKWKPKNQYKIGLAKLGFVCEVRWAFKESLNSCLLESNIASHKKKWGIDYNPQKEHGQHYLTWQTHNQHRGSILGDLKIVVNYCEYARDRPVRTEFGCPTEQNVIDLPSPT